MAEASSQNDRDNPLAGLTEPEVVLVPGPVARRYALLVGVNRYEDRLFRELKYAVNDVKQLGRVLGAYGYEVETLSDSDDAASRPTCENVRTRLAALVEKAGPDDLVFVHFSCHGKMKDGQTMLMLADTRWQKIAFEPTLPIADVKDLLRGGRSRRLVLLFDACQTAGAGREVLGPDDHARFLRDAYLNTSGLAVLASCSEGQIAHEPDSLGHGVFTYYVLEGLREAAVDPQTRLVTASQLAAYVSAKLKEWWQSEGVEFQLPDLELHDADLALADRSQVGSPEALWRLTKKVRRLAGHTKAVRKVVALSDGSDASDRPLVVTASDDGTARFWNTATYAPVGDPYPHPRGVASVAVQGFVPPDLASLVTVGGDFIARQWFSNHSNCDFEFDAASPTLRPFMADDGSSPSPPPSPPSCYDVAFSADVRYLAMAVDRGALLWDWPHPEPLELALLGHQGPVRAVTFSPDGRFIATAGDDGKVIVRDFATKGRLWVCVPPAGAPSGPLRALAFSPDGERLASAGVDDAPSGRLRNAPRVWNTATGELTFTLEGHGAEVTALAFSPDGRLLLTTSLDGAARLWNASEGTLLETFDQPNLPVTAGAFSAEGASVVLGYDDGTLLVFDAPPPPP